ncbi:Tyrosinase central domain-containing protein [Mycena chlorophos]|uniref:Tyrosinase central domain-containing protein n=1 Tax=Mycena chlorophos TaxID=658473 RepID=A0A8H6WIU6_MYCCL|nr:Tyrosinase central domain-containing protein [Mycena chlorophos]
MEAQVFPLKTTKPVVPRWQRQQRTPLDISACVLLLSTVILVLLSSALALVVVLAFSAVHNIATAPSTASTTTSGCTTPFVRKEWRALTGNEQLGYIAAVQCLQGLPTITGLHGAKTRFDDFQAVHVVQAEAVHLVGHFLPWHRYFLHTFENALRGECGYEGSIPYWDWSRDIDNGVPLSRSPIFHPLSGFGGNGADVPNYAGQFGNLSLMASAGWVPPGGGGGCVTDGPFAGYMLNVGPGTNITRHCLQRAFNDNLKGFLTGARVVDVMAQTTFEAFRTELEGAPVTSTMRLHDAGHNTVGGEMADRYSSPGDPIFYSHHGFLDKLWADWIDLDFSPRVVDMSGRSTVDPPYQNVTLSYELDLLGLAPVMEIREMMDTRSELLCYIYE